jgi:hypothetical protein
MSAMAWATVALGVGLLVMLVVIVLMALSAAGLS